MVDPQGMKEVFTAIEAAKTTGTYTIVVALISGFVGLLIGILGAFNVLRGNERKIEIENIVQERAKWREFIRSWLVDVTESSRDGKILKSEIISRINLKDPNDESIIQTLDALLSSTTDEGKKKQLHNLQIKISALLKEDWERVKLETMPIYKCKKSMKKKVETIRNEILSDNLLPEEEE